MAQVGASARIGRLRAVVGHEVLHLPSVSVIPVNEAGRVLLVRHVGLHDGWGGPWQCCRSARVTSRYSRECDAWLGECDDSTG